MTILFHFFVGSSQVIVVILHYMDAERIWNLTLNSHLKGHLGLSPFCYKASLLKKVYK